MVLIDLVLSAIASFVAIPGFDELLPGSDSHLFDGLASALNTQFVLRLRYSQPDI
jgi:hypothetical protein